MDFTAGRIDWFKRDILPHERALRAYLRRALTDQQGLDCDDILSEALTRTYAAADYERITAGRAYLFSIARNLLIDAARRRAIASFDQLTDADASLAAADLASCLEARDGLRRLEKIVDDLPPQPRRVFLLRRVEDFSMAEIADKLGLSVSTVEKHLAKAIALITRALEKIEDWNVDDAIRNARTTVPARATGSRDGGAVG